MAQLHRTITPALRTPLPAPSDSEDVALALETARALEARGDMSEAVRWLRRAAQEAEDRGDDVRVLLFAHVAADLTNGALRQPLAPAPPPARREEPSDPEPTIRESDFAATVPRARSLEHRGGQPDATLNTIPDDDESSAPTIAPPALAPKIAPGPPAPRGVPSISIARPLPVSADRPAAERVMRLGAVRVAIRKPTPDTKAFSVELLDAGQEAPKGTIEAMLVVPGGIDSQK